MTLPQIKKKMIAYRDLYGGSLLDSAEINSANSKTELAGIIEKHRQHMNAMLSDAESNLDRFKTEIGLDWKSINQ